MRDAEEALAALGRSPFRARIRLGAKELRYLREKGIDEVLSHGARFIEERLAPAAPLNDGKQTPRGNHPAFTAQHATATCCRSCLEKWHGIPQGREMTAAEKRFVLELIGGWLSRQGSGAVISEMEHRISR